MRQHLLDGDGVLPFGANWMISTRSSRRNSPSSNRSHRHADHRFVDEKMQ
jgi:hypothetical protein